MDIDHDAGPTLNQHISNVPCFLGGATGANRSGTARCGQVTDLIVCIHIRLTLPLPQQRAIVVICSAKAVSAHLYQSGYCRSTLEFNCRLTCITDRQTDRYFIDRKEKSLQTYLS